MIISEMLPELLFSVGNSMQDFSKEEFSLLGGGVGVSGDKDATSATLTNHNNNNVIADIKLAQTPDLIESTEAIKLEESSDLYQWNTNNIGSNLLRSSDDPLISGGTNDNQHDNELSVTPNTQSICKSPNNKRSNASKLLSSDLSVSPVSKGAKKNSGRPRRKGQFKLRFHHQALPPEYLDHYEATQNSLQKKEALLQQQQQSKQTKLEKELAHSREERANESVRNWLQKILELQKEGVSLAPVKDEMDLAPEPAPHASNSVITNVGTTIKANKVVSYKDLPYMGEMTLENSKPRRGRKPKKADICHLIYKNYGTIFPGTPKGAMIENGKDLHPTTSDTNHKTEHQNKAISSLLEKRLTSQTELQKTRQSPPQAQVNVVEDKIVILDKKKLDEPLNLCVRDAGADSVTVSSSDDESDDVFGSSCNTPVITPSDITTDSSLAANLKMSLPNFQSALMDTSPSPDTPSTSGTPPGYVYWPSAGVFIHPMALYYQKMVDASTSPVSSATPSTTPASNATTLSEPLKKSLPLSKPPSPTQQKKESQKILVPKNISQLLKHDKPPQVPPESNGAKQSPPVLQKRKRSAIFIPPVPAENSSNPATEVSICKFKFTGGAKPCLQEKKMLSVDSGGNFRYYSGTGDKSMRGYEFFPRESLQQSSLTSTSTTGAFLNTSGEKILGDLPPPSLGLSNELLQIPEFPSTSASTASHPHRPSNGTRDTGDRRKRKSRRSIQRENLEKTFKEKGFLIQTQQLQSAEGATYCKFRQLRKFTRYLFRSWKDYLPGELQQNQQGLPGTPHNFDENSLLPSSINRMSPPPPPPSVHMEPAKNGKQS